MSYPKILVTLFCAIMTAEGSHSLAVDELWSHLKAASDFGELREASIEWQPSAAGGRLTIHTQPARYAWAVIPPPKGGWELGSCEAVEAMIVNRGLKPVEVLMWVVGDRGWESIADTAKLEPGEPKLFSCKLRATFPDGTPKLDPGKIKQLQIMVARTNQETTLEVNRLMAVGEAPAWQRPSQRMEVPPVEDTSPVAGRRVRYRLADEGQPGIYGVLQLPEEWKEGGRFPVIVEYPGNIFFTAGCYSTGLPDQCVIGYGMTQGQGAICIGLPFIERSTGAIAEHGWGNADETADYAMRFIDEVCQRFGGDRSNLVLTGFSRGAIACGYIGLRNDRIAPLWKGFHACQHYDGDGWNGATMAGAMERARRFVGRSVFQTDNSERTFQPLMDAMRAQATFVQSGLGAHATAMFLDDRPSTLQLRAWFDDLVSQP
jgi:hypothetical protein